MIQRVMIEFVVEVPNPDVARDVETRIAREHMARLAEVFASVTGYAPFRTPGNPGFYLMTEPVTWNSAEKEWVGENDGEDDDDDE